VLASTGQHPSIEQFRMSQGEYLGYHATVGRTEHMCAFDFQCMEEGYEVVGEICDGVRLGREGIVTYVPLVVHDHRVGVAEMTDDIVEQFLTDLQPMDEDERLTAPVNAVTGAAAVRSG